MPINHLSTIDYSLKVSNYVINSIDFRKVSTNSKKLPMSTLKKWSRTYTPQWPLSTSSITARAKMKSKGQKFWLKPWNKCKWVVVSILIAPTCSTIALSSIFILKIGNRLMMTSIAALKRLNRICLNTFTCEEYATPASKISRKPSINFQFASASILTSNRHILKKQNVSSYLEILKKASLASKHSLSSIQMIWPSTSGSVISYMKENPLRTP